MTDHHIRAWDLCIGQQIVEVGGNRDAVLRTGWGIAPALARAVVSADGGVLRDGWRDPASPVHGGLGQTGHQYDSRAARAGAVQVEAASADVDQVAGHRGGAPVDLFLNRLVTASDPGDNEADAERVQDQPARDAA